MQDKWTDFEKYVFNKLEKIDKRMSKIETRAAVLGALGAAFVAAFKAFITR